MPEPSLAFKELLVELKQTKISIRGTVPIVMHNGQLADPLNEHKLGLDRLTLHKKKTLELHKQISQAEWNGGLYLDEDGEPCIPGDVLQANLIEGAKKFKLGKIAKGALVVDGNFKLIYKGPKTVDAMWKSGNHLLRVGMRNPSTGGRIMRSRPIFNDWSLNFTVLWDPEMLRDEKQLLEIAESAGAVGLCDSRPRYGRYLVVQ
jgi:hypothetical protein